MIAIQINIVSHEIDWFLLTVVMIYTIVGLVICIIAILDFRKGVRALDYIIVYFGLLTLTGIIQFLIPFLHDDLSFFFLYYMKVLPHR